MDLVLNNLQRLICHKTQQTKPTNQTNNLIKHQSFVYTQLNVKIALFLTIQFSISHIFGHNSNVKHFFLTHRYGPYQVLPHPVRVELGVMAMKGYFTFLKAPALREPNIRLSNVIFRTLIGGGGFLPFCRETVGVFYTPPAPTGLT